MTTITKERIEQYANDPRMFNVNDEIRQIARIALASLEEEAIGEVSEKRHGLWICPYISRHLLSLNPLLARCRRYSRGER